MANSNLSYEQWKDQRLKDAIILLEEARDAIRALSVAQCKLYNISLDLADRMDEVGYRKFDGES